MVSLRGMLEDETTTVQTVDGGEVEVAFDALLDALENRLAGIFEVADGFDADADEAAPPPDVAHVSPRNNDPAYREAREQFNQIRAAERVANAGDGPVVPLPVPHRDEMSDSERARAAFVGEVNERYLGKDAGMYVVRMPFRSNDKDIIVGVLYAAVVRFSPVATVPEVLSEFLKNNEVVLHAVFEQLPDPLRQMVLDNAFVADEGSVPEPTIIGKVDDEDGEVGPDAWMVTFQLPERMVMILLQSA